MNGRISKKELFRYIIMAALGYFAKIFGVVDLPSPY